MKSSRSGSFIFLCAVQNSCYSRRVPKLFPKNIERKGRLLRAGIGLVFFAAAIIVGQFDWLAGVLLGVGAAFVWFEAARGWCAARACGIKTKF